MSTFVTAVLAGGMLGVFGLLAGIYQATVRQADALERIARRMEEREQEK